MARFEEIRTGILKSYLNSKWNTYNWTFSSSSITAMKFQTGADLPFYFSYRTYNKGRGWLPYVSSKDANEYAGYDVGDTRHVQAVGIQVIDSMTGAKLDKDYIVMYRAYVGGEWLPWVSNASPELMYAVASEHNIIGELDTTSGNAGKPGSDDEMTQFFIRIFKDNKLTDTDTFTGGEVNASTSYLIDSTWNSFNKQAVDAHIDGIKIQTSSNKGYYLLYKTWNEGKTGYYPAVKSTENDYAGSSGKPIQRLNIQVYKNDGTKLTSGVIVMYRACVDGKWLPWVSNADPEWMRAAQTKHRLDGTLDTAGSYAGVGGKNVEGIEVRIFEDDSNNAGAGSFEGSEAGLSMRYMANSATNWNSFNKSVMASPIDGIEIRTNGKDYYLQYKTWNEGKTGYYPAVKSTANDYAGSPGKPIQRLSIEVYRNNGTKLTTGIVVMYRTYVEGRWLPWVSNADPEWMQNVKTQYNLDGALDVNSGYAGISGKNIEGVEIRVFEGSTLALPETSLPGAESTATMSYLKNGTWNSFNKSVLTTGIDGVKIQTPKSKAYYLSYKTWNAGKASFYPAVKSTESDYAGYPGKSVQRLAIQVYRNDGTKLTTGVVVMYRAYVDGAWLPWVSNADPEWMEAAQIKYALGGRLDTASYYAGIGGKNIEGLEIRIFEENTSTVVPTGNGKIINVPFITQLGSYPTGCESVSTVMALKYAGVNISVDEFINNYLDKKSYPFDPNLAFGGNPYSSSGYGCYSLVIKMALDKFLPNLGYRSRILAKPSLEKLCKDYIDHNVPVIIWATMGMRQPYVSRTWTYNGKTIQWIAPEHCLVLVGYDDNHYIFNDPQKYAALTYYSKEAVKTAYEGLNKQAVVIMKETDSILNPPVNYIQPAIPAVPAGTTSILQLIENIRQLEDIYAENNSKNPKKIVLGITNFLRSLQYKDYEWYMTTLGRGIDLLFVEKIRNHYQDLWNRFYPFICQEETGQKRQLISDGGKGLLDLAHFAATLDGYVGTTLTPSYWTGWGGDFATGIAKTQEDIDTQKGVGGKYAGKSDQEIANATIGNEETSCNYTDFCCDFDAYKISKKIQETCDSLDATGEENYHVLSDSLYWYYTHYANLLFTKRFQWIVEELNCSPTMESIRSTVFEWLSGKSEKAILLPRLADSPAESIVKNCCNAFANYIYTMIS